MTLVVGIIDKKNDRVVIGSDSQVSYNGLKDRIIGNVSKVFKLKDDIVVGGAGYLRDVQLIQCSELSELFDIESYYENKIDYNYVVNNLFMAIYNKLKDNLCIDKTKDNHYERCANSVFLFGIKNKLYRIGHYGSVTEASDYLVIGSGSEVAIGVLETNKDKKPEQRIKEAIKAASDKTLYVDNKVNIVTTKG